MPQQSPEQRRSSTVGLQVAAAVLIPAAMGLVTEAAGDALPAVNGREQQIWALLLAVIVVGVGVVVAGNTPRRRRRRRLGRPVGDFTAAQLEVHDPIEIQGQHLPQQTEYVLRAHDEQLNAAVREAGAGASRMVTLIGDSSTGKTRACLEAVRHLPKRWRLWHPIDPSRPEAVLESLADVRPHTVLCINDAHHYLATADPQVGTRVAAGLRTLLHDTARAPVLILVTLWPRFWRQLTATPADGAPDPYAPARDLLTGTDLAVPAAFAGADLAAVRPPADRDPRLALALEHAEAGRITQHLAGVPELLRRYRTAAAPARAVLDAAIDARRLGHPVHLPGPLLRQAALGYLSEADRSDLHRHLGDQWFDRIVDDLEEPECGIPGPLSRIAGGRDLRLADAVEQAGVTARAVVFPPAGFWEAVADTVTDHAVLTVLAGQAQRRGRYRRAARLYRHAADLGGITALQALAMLRERVGDHRQAEVLSREAADLGDAAALRELAWRREQAGDRSAAERLYREAADRGHAAALRGLAQRHKRAGDGDSADQLYHDVLQFGDTVAFRELIRRRDTDHRHTPEQPEDDTGDRAALLAVLMQRLEAGDHAGAEQLARQAADRGDAATLMVLAMLRNEAGDHNSAEELYQQAADSGDTTALWTLVRRYENEGDRSRAESLARQAADHGDTDSLLALAWRRERTGD
jgi:hypothetical protein